MLVLIQETQAYGVFTYRDVKGQVGAVEKDYFAGDHILVGPILVTFPAQTFPVFAAVVGLVDSMFRCSA